MTIEINPRTEEIAGTGVTLDLTTSNAGLAAGSGQLVQQKNAETATYFGSITTVIPADDTIPQSTEGDEILTVSITPTDAANILFVDIQVEHSANGVIFNTLALFKDSDTDALSSICQTIPVVNHIYNTPLKHQMTAGTTSPITFKLRCGPSSGTMYINGNTSRVLGGTSKVTMRVIEVDPTALSPATPGLLLQHVYAEDRTYQTLSATVPHDDTIMQSTEGTEIVTVAITPISASSILEVTGHVVFNSGSTSYIAFGLFRDSIADALDVSCSALTGADYCDSIPLHHRVVSGSTSPTTFKLRVGPQSGNVYINGNSGGRIQGGAYKTYIQVKELTP